MTSMSLYERKGNQLDYLLILVILIQVSAMKINKKTKLLLNTFLLKIQLKREPLKYKFLNF